MIQQDLLAFSFVAGLGVGSGAFVLLSLLRVVGRDLHPETAQTWVFLWVSVSFTVALVVLDLDIFVRGRWDLLYVVIIAIGASGSYLISGRVVGRPWVSHIEPG